MVDYISRETAISEILSEPTDAHYPSWYAEKLKQIPAADVRPVVRARWYWDNYRYDWCCVNCFHSADHCIDKDDVYKKPSFKFCPHCGADMREVDADGES